MLVPCVVANERPVKPLPPGDRLRLVAVGGLVPGKRPLLAIRTIAALKEAGHDVHLNWVGDGPLRGEAEDLISELQLGENVTLVGTVPPAEVFAYFEQAHLFFLPTAHENFFTSAAEALSAGRPVVVPRVGGFTDYVTPANGVLVDDASPESLAAAIQAARLELRRCRPLGHCRAHPGQVQPEHGWHAVRGRLRQGARRQQEPPGAGMDKDVTGAAVPAVDVVIAVHSSTRPVARALASVAAAGLELNGPDGVRATVVCHNISRDEISRNVPPELACSHQVPGAPRRDTQPGRAVQLRA